MTRRFETGPQAPTPPGPATRGAAPAHAEPFPARPPLRPALRALLAAGHDLAELQAAGRALEKRLTELRNAEVVQLCQAAGGGA